ncbi:MAG: hypothetical protein ACO3EZ_18350 [Prochlorotrichaceae cyanobacterium]
MLFSAPAFADYATGGASVSTTQELTLVILPAIETRVFSTDAPVVSPGNGISQEWIVGVRANTEWSSRFEAGGNLISDPLCSPSTISGQSNSDDRYQLYSVQCLQDVSWADSSGAAQLQAAITITSTLR